MKAAERAAPAELVMMVSNRDKISAPTAITTFCLFCALLIFAPGRCGAMPKMGPAMAGEVSTLIRSNSAAFPLPDGWKIIDYKYSDLVINATLGNGAGGKAVVRLAYFSLPPAGARIGETNTFRVELANMEGEGAEVAARDFFKRIKNNEQGGYFFSSKKMESSELRLNHLLRKYIFTSRPGKALFFSALSLIAIVLMVAGVGRKSLLLAPAGAAAAVALAAIVALGFIVRLCASPMAPVHCNNHGVREIRSYVYPTSPEQTEMNYGEVFPAFVAWFLGFTNGKAGALFAMNLMFGSLAVLSMFLLARAMTGSDPPALFAALLMAVSPGMVWISGTESQITLYIFSALLGLAILASAAETQNEPLLWMAAAVVAFAASLRILTVLLVPAAVIVFFFKTPRPAEKRSARFLIHAAAALFLISLWSWLHYLTIPKMTEKGWASLSLLNIASAFFHRANILWDPTLTIIALPLLLCAGLIISCFKNRRLAISAALLLLILVPLTFTVIDCRTTSLRYQIQAHWIYYLLAGAVFSWRPKTNKKLCAAVAACAVAAVIANSAFGLALLRSGDEEINEYRFIKVAAQKIPRETVIRLPVSNAANGKLITEFPDFIAGQRIVRGTQHAPAGSREVAYIGLDCYRYETIEEKKRAITAGGIRRECAEACPAGYKTLYETTLDASTDKAGFQKRFYSVSTPAPRIAFIECLANK